MNWGNDKYDFEIQMCSFIVHLFLLARPGHPSLSFSYQLTSYFFCSVHKSPLWSSSTPLSLFCPNHLSMASLALSPNHQTFSVPLIYPVSKLCIVILYTILADTHFSHIRPGTFLHLVQLLCISISTYFLPNSLLLWTVDPYTSHLYGKTSTSLYFPPPASCSHYRL